MISDRIKAHRSAPDVYDPPTFDQMADRIEELEAKLAKAVEIAELFSGGVEYDYHGNIIGEEEQKAMVELEELKEDKE